MDGFAYAGALAGKNRPVTGQPFIRLSGNCLAGASTFYVLPCFMLLAVILGLLTNEVDVINEAENYFYWVLVILLPIFRFFGTVSLSAPQLPGKCLFHVYSFHLLFATYYSFHSLMGNHAL